MRAPAVRNASVIETLVATVTDGPFLLAAPIAIAAGLVSFLSPCCLPLVPGYLSYMTGLSGAELEAASMAKGAVPAAAGACSDDEPARAPVPRPAGAAAVRRAPVLAASVLFVLGFSAVFVTAAPRSAGWEVCWLFTSAPSTWSRVCSRCFSGWRSWGSSRFCSVRCGSTVCPRLA
jgi:hypothetical protein